ncbi:MAG TPA: WD40 repeat domain-containing protein, partial [Pyrinomonadaceae bacterium]|nr:WD40 repeat domain-containing protein [Pyrinomonadaceae bacterium]
AGIENNPLNPQIIANAANGRPVLRWDGSDSSFSFHRISDIRTFFWVMKKERRSIGPPNIRFILGEKERGPRYDADFHSGTHQTGLIWSATLSSPYIRSGQTRLNQVLVDGTTTEMPTQLAVLSVVTTGKIAADQLCRDRSLTDGRSWWGDLAEILVYNVPLSDSEREAVERYLMSKYGIKANSGKEFANLTPAKVRLNIAGAHTSPISSLAFSPDGQMIASASYDNTAKLWEAATGKPVRTFSGHENRVWSVVFSPDGKSLLTGAGDKSARIWDVASGQVTRTYAQDMPFWRADYSPDGKFIAAGGMPHLSYPGRSWVVIFGTRASRMFEVLDGHQGNIWWVTFSRDNSMLATSCEDKTIKLWATRGWGLLRSIDVGSPTWSFGLSPDSKMIVSAHPDGTIKFWEVETGWLRRTRLAHDAAATTALYSPDGRLVASAGADGTIVFWDAATGDPVERFTAHDDEVWALAFSPDGKSLVSAGRDGSIKLWDVRPAAENPASAR